MFKLALSLAHLIPSLFNHECQLNVSSLMSPECSINVPWNVSWKSVECIMNAHWMYHESSLKVSRMSTKCINNVPWIHECPINISWISPECITNVPWMIYECLHEWIMSFPWMYHECTLNISRIASWIYHECFMNVHWTYQECPLNVPRMWICSKFTRELKIPKYGGIGPDSSLECFSNFNSEEYFL